MTNFDERARMGFAISVWSSLPLLVAIFTVRNGNLTAAAAFLLIALAGLTAGSLARTANGAFHLVGVALLVLLWLPFAIQMTWRFAFGFGAGVLRVADSPLAFVVGAVFESLFVAPLAVFAIGLWRRRA